MLTYIHPNYGGILQIPIDSLYWQILLLNNLAHWSTMDYTTYTVYIQVHKGGTTCFSSDIYNMINVILRLFFSFKKTLKLIISSTHEFWKTPPHTWNDACVITDIHPSISCSYHASVMKFSLQVNQSNVITPANMAAFSFYRCILGLCDVSSWSSVAEWI